MVRKSIPAVALWAAAFAWAWLAPADAIVPHEQGGSPELVLIGMVLALTLYNSLVAVATGEALFLVYALYALSSLVMWTTYFDTTSSWLPSWELRLRVNHVATTCLAAFVLEFTRRFLDTRRRVPRLDAALRSLSASAFAALPAVALLPQLVVERALAIVLGTVAVVGLASMFEAVLAGVVAGMLMLVAFAPFAFAGVVFALAPLGAASEMLVDGRTLFALHILEMVLLALALAGHIATLRSERDRARERAAAAVAKATVEGLRARTDPLTGLRNRADFERALDGLRDQFDSDVLEDASIAVVDVDGLKLVNDAQGHARGDALLVAFADALQASLRSDDRCFRIGGDEFTLIALGAGAAEAPALTSRLREVATALRDRGFPNASASVGVACLRETEGDPRAAVALADRRMYEDKRSDELAHPSRRPSVPPRRLH